MNHTFNTRLDEADLDGIAEEVESYPGPTSAIKSKHRSNDESSLQSSSGQEEVEDEETITHDEFNHQTPDRYFRSALQFATSAEAANSHSQQRFAVPSARDRGAQSEQPPRDQTKITLSDIKSSAELFQISRRRSSRTSDEDDSFSDSSEDDEGEQEKNSSISPDIDSAASSPAVSFEALSLSPPHTDFNLSNETRSSKGKSRSPNGVTRTTEQDELVRELKKRMQRQKQNELDIASVEMSVQRRNIEQVQSKGQASLLSLKRENDMLLDRLAEVTGEIQDFRERNVVLQEQLLQANAANTASKDTVMSLNQALANAQTRTDEVHSQMQKALSDARDYLSRVEQLEADLEATQLLGNDAEERCEALQADLNATQVRNSDAEGRCKTFQAQLKDSEDRAQQLEIGTKEIQGKFDGVLNDLEVARTALKHSKQNEERLDVLLNEKAGYEEEMNSAIQDSKSKEEEQIVELQSRLDNSKADVARMKSHKAQDEEQMIELQSALDSLNAEMSRTQSYKTQAEEQIDELQSRLDNANAEVTRLQSDKTQDEGEIYELKSQLHSVNANVTMLNTQKTQDEKKIVELQSALDSVNAEVATTQLDRTRDEEHIVKIQSLLDNANTEVARLQSDTTQDEEKIIELEAMLNSANENITMLNAQKTQGEGKINELQSTLDTAIADVTMLNARRTHDEEEIVQLQSRLDSTNADVTRLHENNTDHENEISELKSRLDDVNADGTRLDAEKTQDEDEIIELQSRLASARDEVTRLKAEMTQDEEENMIASRTAESEIMAAKADAQDTIRAQQKEMNDNTQQMGERLSEAVVQMVLELGKTMEAHVTESWHRRQAREAVDAMFTVPIAYETENDESAMLFVSITELDAACTAIRSALIGDQSWMINEDEVSDDEQHEKVDGQRHERFVATSAVSGGGKESNLVVDALARRVLMCEENIFGLQRGQRERGGSDDTLTRQIEARVNEIMVERAGESLNDRNIDDSERDRTIHQLTIELDAAQKEISRLREQLEDHKLENNHHHISVGGFARENWPAPNVTEPHSTAMHDRSMHDSLLGTTLEHRIRMNSEDNFSRLQACTKHVDDVGGASATTTADHVVRLLHQENERLDEETSRLRRERDEYKRAYHAASKQVGKLRSNSDQLYTLWQEMQRSQRKADGTNRNFFAGDGGDGDVFDRVGGQGEEEDINVDVEHRNFKSTGTTTKRRKGTATTANATRGRGKSKSRLSAKKAPATTASAATHTTAAELSASHEKVKEVEVKLSAMRSKLKKVYVWGQRESDARQHVEEDLHQLKLKLLGGSGEVTDNTTRGFTRDQGVKNCGQRQKESLSKGKEGVLYGSVFQQREARARNEVHAEEGGASSARRRGLVRSELVGKGGKGGKAGRGVAGEADDDDDVVIGTTRKVLSKQNSLLY